VNVAHRSASPMARAGTVALVGAPAAAQDIKERSSSTTSISTVS
jgi:hypothetical protein